MTHSTVLEAMTHEELVKHALDLQAQLDSVAYSIDTHDLAYVFSSMFSVPEEYISTAMVERARDLMKSKFAINEETSEIIEFLEAKQVDWKEEYGVYSGLLDNDGDILVYFTDERGDHQADLLISGEAEVHRFLETVLGDGWEEQVTDSPSFSFHLSSLENYA